MYCFNLKNRLSFVSLAILASSSSLLAMEPMEVDSSAPSTRTRSKRAASCAADDLRKESAFEAYVVFVATVAPSEESLIEQNLHKRRKTSHPLSNKENDPLLTISTSRDTQEAETFALQTKLKKAQNEIQILETKLETHQRNSQGLKECYQDKIQDLEDTIETHQDKPRELRGHLQKTRAMYQDQFQELENRLQNLGEMYQVKFQELETTAVENHNKIQTWEEQHQATQRKNKELEEKLQHTEEKYQELGKKMMIQKSTPIISPELFNTVRLKHQAAETKLLSLQALTQETLSEKNILMNTNQKLIAEKQNLMKKLQEFTSFYHQVTTENHQLKLELQDAKDRLARQYSHTSHIPNVGLYNLPPATNLHPSSRQWENGYATNQPIQSNFVFPGSWGENSQQR